MEQHISYRTITEDDAEFLYAVYASTRQEELAQTGWSEEQKEQFLRMQFRAQHQHYQQHYADASFEIILLDGQPIGRLYLRRSNDEHRIVDIALLSEYRGRGIGKSIMNSILDGAQREGKPVRIHVERNNPALGLYHQLGFVQIEDKGVYLFMEWLPTTPVK